MRQECSVTIALQPACLPLRSPTYGVLSWRMLFERGREGNRGHHGQRVPLFRILPHVDGLRGEVPEGRQKIGALPFRRVHFSELL